jgi:hypothetical protein
MKVTDPHVMAADPRPSALTRWTGHQRFAGGSYRQPRASHKPVTLAPERPCGPYRSPFSPRFHLLFGVRASPRGDISSRFAAPFFPLVVFAAFFVLAVFFAIRHVFIAADESAESTVGP